MVVIGIISALIALLMPAVQSARSAARRTQCQNNLRQLGIAFHNYHDAHNTLPPGAIALGPAFAIQTGWGWGAQLLPQLEQSALYNQIDFHTFNAVGANRLLIGHPLSVFQCPADPAPSAITVDIPTSGPTLVAHGDYPASGALLSEMSRVRFGDVTDGLSQTLLVGERKYGSGSFGEQTSAWCGIVTYEAEYLYFHSTPFLRVPPDSAEALFPFTSWHVGGVQFLLADGSVHFLSSSLDSRVFYALYTPNGGEAVATSF